MREYENFLQKATKEIDPILNEFGLFYNNELEKFIGFTDYEVLLISNGSTESNLKYAKTIVDDKLFHFSLKQSGKGLAIKHGIENAKFNNILFMDADFSVSITELDKFIDKNGLIGDALIGDRRSSSSVNSGTPFIRKLVGSTYLLTMKLVLGFKLSDTQCGFKIFKKNDYLVRNPFWMGVIINRNRRLSCCFLHKQKLVRSLSKAFKTV